ncbi:hypothetical protein LOD99_14164 [Oopsacas minuta]|uniref:Protein kinase domain-containing protein n=1 Tax=Oopsacas minuta TaxID=111878 RepID=A0AAV7KIM1_9METZ|nr:hypothetical protein LOD99_14164 [Oopsacas minuta]
MAIAIKESNISEDYNILWEKPLGCGVNGDVYKCTEIRTGQKYALKLLPDCDATRREIQLQASCFNCEHIVPIHALYRNALILKNKQGVKIEKEENSLFVVMELMNGGELFDHLQQKQISEEEAKQFVKQILKAIEFIHEGNIVHRDLKPENILMDVSTSEEEKAESITLKLADFGYAEMDDNGLTNPLYTLYYVAPEVLSNDTRFRKESDKACPPMTYDKKCDIWSLGVITYIMLMGYPPFSPDGPNIEMTSTMYQSILSGDYYYGEMDWKKYSGDAHDFVFSLLHVNPEDRPCAKELLLHPWLQ